MKSNKFFVLIGIKRKDLRYKEVAAVNPFRYRGIKLFTWKQKNPCPDICKYQVLERKTGIYIDGSNDSKEQAIKNAKKKIDKLTPKHVKNIIKKAIIKYELYDKHKKLLGV